MAEFAELVFAYIDELSAASVAGHTDELSISGRVRERYLGRLGQDLLAGARPDVLTAAAERAGWTPPRTLTAVLLPAAQVRGAVASLHPDTLQVGEDLPGLQAIPGRDAGDERALLLVPDMEGPGRGHLLRVLQGRWAVVGPARPWTQARSSYLRAVRTLELTGAREGGKRPERGLRAGGPVDPANPVDPVDTVDTEEHLADLVVEADPEALEDLRTAVLAPLASLRPSTAQRLAETLRAWLLHQGRRDAVAEHLHVHAQTVRYRMAQLRELYGDRLDDPRTVLELVLALHPGGLEAGGSARGLAGEPAVGRAPGAELAVLDVDGLGPGADILLQRGLPA
jgi:hypothetical protein